MLILCGRKWGLVCSVTRFVYFGKLPDDLRRKVTACAHVDGVYIGATRPGQTLGRVFELAQAAYAEAGFANEWQKHHQGGPAGYEPREFLATPGLKDVVAVGQAYAWNPSITGAKTEDSILVGEKGNEVVTATSGLPTLLVTRADGTQVARPMILENP